LSEETQSVAPAAVDQMLVEHDEPRQHRATRQLADIGPGGRPNVRSRSQLRNPSAVDDERLIVSRRRTISGDDSDVAEQQRSIVLTGTLERQRQHGRQRKSGD
jgi:hypothetical protein